MNRWLARTIILSGCILAVFTAPVTAQDDADAPSINAYDLAGDAGVIVAIGGLALNFFNTRNKFTRLEMERLREMQDNIDEERSKLRARLEEQYEEVTAKNHELQIAIAGLQSKITAVEVPNRQLKHGMSQLEYENKQLKAQLKLMMQKLQ
jgi:hypothetical protein